MSPSKHTFDFRVIIRSPSFPLFKGVCWNAPLSLPLPLGTISSPILQPHTPTRAWEHFGGVTSTFGVTGRGLGLAGGAPLFALVGKFGIQLRVARRGHHCRGTDHHLLLWFGATEEREKKKVRKGKSDKSHLWFIQPCRNRLERSRNNHCRLYKLRQLLTNKKCLQA